MSQSSPVLALPFIQPAQAQKHVTHNEALRVLDVLVQLRVLDWQLNTPPAASEGDVFIVGSAGQGAWAGRSGQVAWMSAEGWNFLPPQTGWQALLLPGPGMVYFDGTDWVRIEGATGGPVDTFGINAVADTQNRLSLSSPSALFNHEGAGHQVKINKAQAGDTASLLFQTGFSGRAEMGTTGSDAFQVKVSPDGATWNTGLRVTTNGVVNCPEGAMISKRITGLAVTQGRADATAGRLIRTQDGYVKSTILGTVSEVSGQPSGAILERGGDAQGRYLRLADGTQMCTHTLTTDSTQPLDWVFPVVFSGGIDSVSVTPVSSVAAMATCASVQNDQVSLNGWSHDGTRIAVDVHVTAYGRWF